jgi:hypothetical protein
MEAIANFRGGSVAPRAILACALRDRGATDYRTSAAISA